MSDTRIRAIALDVDGVLTDGGFYWGVNGEELKRFHFLDVMGIARTAKAGVRFALISGEDSPLVRRFAAKLSIADVYPGCKDKAAALRTFVESRSLTLDSVCFMGDDVNDLAAMRIAAISAAPSSAHALVLSAVDIVTEKPGGNGAVRELIDLLIAKGWLPQIYE